MGTSDSNALVDAYQNRIGVPSTGDEAYGYWVFVLGVLAGFVGIALVMLSQEPGETIRGVGIAIAAIGLVLLLIGPIIRLPLKRGATILSYLGGLIALVGVGWFFLAFQAGNWGAAFANSEVLIIGVYGLGIFAIVLGSIFVPLLTSPREEQMAAEARAAEAESQREAAIEEAEQRARKAEAEAKRAREEAERTVAAESESARLAAELEQIEASQSQFEIYEDAGGKHRWRLRHQNRNVIAASGQGYSSRQSCQRGLSAVRRDAFGASVIDLDELEEPVEIEDVDDVVEGDEAPEFVEEATSKADFETYEDNAGDHRWRLRHDNGEIIADCGEGYSTTDSRDDAVERVRGYAQSADYLRIDPAAFELFRDNGGKYRWRLLHKNGNILADSGQGYASRQKARQGIGSVQRNVDGGNAEFEVYEDKGGNYRWRLTHQNGNIIADCGEGYASESGAEDAVERMTEYAPEAHVLDVGSAAFEIFEDAGEKWRWRLRHRNGRILADSGQGYASRTGAEDGISSVKQNAPNADVTAE
jgi:uncharacterized protein YegP (UPF0339 family)